MTNKSDLINCFSAITPSAEQKEKMLQRILALSLIHIYGNLGRNNLQKLTDSCIRSGKK